MSGAKNVPRPILVVDDEPMILDAMGTALRSGGYHDVRTASSADEALAVLRAEPCALATLDLYLGETMGLDLFPQLRDVQPGLPVIVITGAEEVDLAVRSIRLGASDYLVKPVDKTRLLTSVRNALEAAELARENDRLRVSILSGELSDPDAFASITTADPAMLSVFQYIEAIAPTSLPLLLTGETGTGKELVARAVHGASGRDGEFVPVNVAGLDDTLFSDTLFGHRKGAFTGAASDRVGMIARAAGGTLFLDEVGDLSLESQIKLLRLLQEHEYYPLGSDRPLRSDARLVFAANRPLEQLVEERLFRQDLYYRLRSHSVTLPPLRERREDIPMLVEQFATEAADELGRPVPDIPAQALRALQTYDYPGNIRELRGLVFDEVLRAGGGPVSVARLQGTLGSVPAFEDDAAPSSGEGDGIRTVYARLDTLPALREATDALVDEAVGRAGGSVTEAARMLGLTRSALSKRLSRRGESDS